MKKHLLIAVIIALNTACSEEVEMASYNHQNEQLKEFVIPDTIDVKSELVIAAYYEIHPIQACVIFAYNDTNRTSAKKYSYLMDSSFVVKDLMRVRSDEYTIKEEPSESYVIKPKSVVWMHRSGNTAVTAEYERIDLAK